MQTLREFLEQCSSAAEKVFDRNGVLLPMYHILAQDGHELLLPPPPGLSKNEGIALVKLLFRQMRPQRYLFCDEAWTINAGNAEAAAQIDEYLKQGGLVKNHPKRQEIVLFQAEDRAEGELTAWRSIIRRRGRKPRLGPLSLDWYTSREGRMVGLLPREGALH